MKKSSSSSRTLYFSTPGLWAKAAFLIFLCMLASDASAQPSAYYGRFIGRLILAPDGNGSTMRLVEAYAFVDSSGGIWSAPAGTVSDGASIPQFAKSFIGGSWDGLYRNAAVIHDVACVEKTRPWELVHLTFYHAMLASGVPSGLAKKMYMAVYHFGPRWEPGRQSQPAPRGGWSNGREPVQRQAGTGSCPEGQYEQCIFAVCVCIPNGGSVGIKSESIHPKAEAVTGDSGSDSSAEFGRLARTIDQHEMSGNPLSIEQIQALR